MVTLMPPCTLVAVVPSPLKRVAVAEFTCRVGLVSGMTVEE